MNSDTWNTANPYMQGNAGIRNAGIQAFANGVIIDSSIQAVSRTGHTLSLPNKYYFEVKITDAASAKYTAGVGIHVSSLEAAPDEFMLWWNPDAIGLEGQVYTSGTLLYSFPLPALVGVVGVAVGAGQAWFRVDAGLWNGNPVANPALGIGGLAMTPAPVQYVAIGLLPTFTVSSATGDINTVAPFVHPPPAGFVEWGASTFVPVDPGPPSVSPGSPNPPVPNAVDPGPNAAGITWVHPA